MKTLLKHVIYEYAISVLFDNIRKNLFSRKLDAHNSIGNRTYFTLLTFVEGGVTYQFHQVEVIKVTHRYITFAFDMSIVFDIELDDEDAEIWDDDESPITMELDFLVESI